MPAVGWATSSGWLPEIPLVAAEQAVAGWLDAWAGRPGRDGPTFVITIPGQPRFIGIVGLGDSDSGEGIVGMIYGIAPRWRGGAWPAAPSGSPPGGR